MPNRVVHFEIEAKDMDRAKKFYGEAFGWEMDKMGDEYGGYLVIKTGENTGKMEDMGINGGIYKSMKDDKEINAYRCVIGVEDAEKAAEAVTKAGGKVLSKPSDIPNVGLFVSCKDTEGNNFTMLQPSPNMTPQK